MKVFAPVILLLAALVLIAWFLSSPVQRYVPLVERADLLGDQDYWHGRVVRVKTTGFTAVPGSDDLGYVVKLGDPPTVVISWVKGEAPGNRPAVVVGTVRAGRPLTITDCRPVP